MEDEEVSTMARRGRPPKMQSDNQAQTITATSSTPDYTPVTFWAVVYADKEHDDLLNAIKALADSFVFTGRTARSDYHPSFKIVVSVMYQKAVNVLLNKSASVYAWGMGTLAEITEQAEDDVQ